MSSLLLPLEWCAESGPYGEGFKGRTGVRAKSLVLNDECPHDNDLELVEHSITSGVFIWNIFVGEE
jgi:hypothetical protein